MLMHAGVVHFMEMLHSSTPFVNKPVYFLIPLLMHIHLGCF